METRTVILGATIALTLIFSAGVVTGWFFASPPQDYKQIKTGNSISIDLGLVPMDMTGTDLTGWTLVINFDGYYDTGLGIKLDYYIATKEKTTLEDYSLNGILRQIKNHQ